MTSSYVVNTVYHTSFANGSATFRKSIIDIGLSIFDNMHLITTIKPSIECEEQKDALIRTLIKDFEEQKQRAEDNKKTVIDMKDEEIEMIRKNYVEQIRRYESLLETERLEQSLKLKAMTDDREMYVNNMLTIKNFEIKHLLEVKEHQDKLHENNLLLIEKLQEQVLNLTQRMDEKKSNNIVKVGQMGEESVYHYITSHFTEGILTNTSKQGGQGDLHYSYKNLDILIEVKNKDRITSDDIVKFVRDVKENSNIVGGVFVSIKPDVHIPCHSAYDIEWLDKKPIIFVNQFENLPEMLFVAIKSILFYLDATHTLSKQQLDKTSDELQNLKAELHEFTSTLNKFFPILDEAVKSSKRSYDSLEMLKHALKSHFEAFVYKHTTTHTTSFASSFDLEHVIMIVKKFRSENNGNDPTIQDLVDLGVPAVKIKKLGGIRKLLQNTI